MTLPRRRFLSLATSAGALAAVSRIARAQTYPARPVRIVVGVAAGSAPDIFARLIGQWLSDRLGQPFVVENRPGGGTNIATEAVVRAAPDGHTLLLVGAPNAINATLYDKLNFNFLRDIAPVGSIVDSPEVIVVHPSVPAGTIPELIAYAKANPGKLSMASPGVGSGPHMSGELFKWMAGINMTHVPYRGGGPAHDRPDRRTGAGHVQRAGRGDRAHQNRQGARAGGHHRDALACSSGYADHGRVRAGLPVGRFLRHRRAKGHAFRHRRQAQQGDQCRACRSRHQGAVCPGGRLDARRFARRLRLIEPSMRRPALASVLAAASARRASLPRCRRASQASPGRRAAPPTARHRRFGPCP